MIQAGSCYDSVEAKTPGEMEQTALAIVHFHSGWKSQNLILLTHNLTYTHTQLHNKLKLLLFFR